MHFEWVSDTKLLCLRQLPISSQSWGPVLSLSWIQPLGQDSRPGDLSKSWILKQMPSGVSHGARAGLLGWLAPSQQTIYKPFQISCQGPGLGLWALLRAACGPGNQVLLLLWSPWQNSRDAPILTPGLSPVLFALL